MTKAPYGAYMLRDVLRFRNTKHFAQNTAEQFWTFNHDDLHTCILLIASHGNILPAPV